MRLDAINWTRNLVIYRTTNDSHNLSVSVKRGPTFFPVEENEEKKRKKEKRDAVVDPYSVDPRLAWFTGGGRYARGQFLRFYGYNLHNYTRRCPQREEKEATGRDH